jgi:hypothetical protein
LVGLAKFCNFHFLTFDLFPVNYLSAPEKFNRTQIRKPVGPRKNTTRILFTLQVIFRSVLPSFGRKLAFADPLPAELSPRV